MAISTTERAGSAVSNAADEVTNVAASAARSVGDAVNSGREQVAAAMDDAADMGRDAMRAATAHPVVSLLVLSAVVIGGSMLVAAMLREDGPTSSGGSRGLMGLTSAASGLGPRAAETLTRIRDAAFSFALDKAIDSVDELFPGFRAHYERG
jgi:hypothetical protein